MDLESEHVFADAVGRQLRLNLFRPRPRNADDATRAVVILVHGGSWVGGHRSMLKPLASRFSEQGLFVITPEYRLVRESPWPAQLDDILAAARWTAAHAEEFGIDKTQIVLAGCSAGGHLALLAVAELIKGDVRPAAAFSFFSASALTVGANTPKGLFNATILLGAAASDVRVQDASPLYRLTANFPPVLLVHGGADWMIDPIASVRMYERLAELGVHADLHILANAHHEFSAEPAMMETVAQTARLFLDRLVIEPERWVGLAREQNIFARGREAFEAYRTQALAKAQQQTPA